MTFLDLNADLVSQELEREGRSWQVPWIHSLFGNAAAVASASRRRDAGSGRGDVRVDRPRGDGGTTDIGFGCLSGMFERNDDVLYICYDNEAYMNTGVQRSSATPPAARTATTPAIGTRARQRVRHRQERAAASRWPTAFRTWRRRASSNLRDLEAEGHVRDDDPGARYIHIFVPCPLGWGSAPEDTIKVARLAVECGLFPLFEAHHGEVTSRTPIRRRVPVTEYLQAAEALRASLRQDARRRTHRAHPGDGRPQHRRFGLLEGTPMEKPFAITLDVGSSLANKTGLVAHQAARLRRPPAAVQPRLSRRREHPGLALSRGIAATTKPPGAR